MVGLQLQERLLVLQNQGFIKEPARLLSLKQVWRRSSPVKV